ncbi:NAD(P)H-quinone oxidoreductase chain 4, chloroplastic [Linum grandiflorum]
MLAMYSGQIGLFSSQDLLLFFIMWELELIPVYLLLSMWGRKKTSVFRYKIYFIYCRKFRFFINRSFGYRFIWF